MPLLVVVVVVILVGPEGVSEESGAVVSPRVAARETVRLNIE